MKKPGRSHKKKEPEAGSVGYALKQLRERWIQAKFSRENSKEIIHAFSHYTGLMEGLRDAMGIVAGIRVPRAKKKG